MRRRAGQLPRGGVLTWLARDGAPMAHTNDSAGARKPPWIRVRLRSRPEPAFEQTRALMRRQRLNTVCEEAACPNIAECWANKHATVMILGNICTRACAFCNVATGKPGPVDAMEPENLAKAVAEMGMKHLVITSVDRDDLDDGGAAQFVKCVERIREASPGTTIEILTPDFRDKPGALEAVIAAGPDVFNHNLETVPRLYPSIRPGARYFTSLRLLEKAKELDPEIFTKSGIMVGLGEAEDEVHGVMDELRGAEVDFLTVGQYLQPTVKHLAVERFVTPEEFQTYEAAAYARGFLMVAATPLTRSSYHAGDHFEQLRGARAAKLAEV